MGNDRVTDMVEQSMSPLAELGHEALETSTMTDRELLVSMYDAVRQINGNVKNHNAQLKFLWTAMGFFGTGLLTIIGLLAGHVL